MSQVVIGRTCPPALIAILRSMGMPERTKSFSLRCDGSDKPLILECTFYARQPGPGETFDQITETKQYRLVEQ